MPSLQLKVDSAYPGDQGCGKVRLDPEAMLAIKVCPDDIVAIEGKRRTVARVWRSLVEDWSQRKIRIDQFTQQNLGVSLGDNVQISKIEEEILVKRMVITLPEDLSEKNTLENNPAIVNSLVDFPILKDDIVPINVSPPWSTPQIVGFKVTEVEPEDACLITKDTAIEFSVKPEAMFEDINGYGSLNVGGLNGELQRLREIIVLPIIHPELVKRLGLYPPRGVLLHGPSGNGKTLIGKAIASETGLHFIYLAGPEILSKYVGESEQRIRDIFNEARENAPSIIFIDELESIARNRETKEVEKPHDERINNEAYIDVEQRVVAQLLAMMDGLEESDYVFVIGATRNIDLIEPALRRGGRFEEEILIGLPDELGRLEILKIHTQKMPISNDVNLDVIAQQTDGFGGADLVAVIRDAAIRSLRRILPDLYLDVEEILEKDLNMIAISQCDFQDAIIKIKNQIGKRRPEKSIN